MQLRYGDSILVMEAYLSCSSSSSLSSKNNSSAVYPLFVLIVLSAPLKSNSLIIFL